MRIKRLIKRAADGVLAPFGLKVASTSGDLENRPTGYAEGRMLRSLAEAFDTWAHSSTTWPVSHLTDSFSAIKTFYDAYLGSVFQAADGGSRFNNLLWLHLIAKATRPSAIIDSGTFRGASAWAFATALPQCPIYSFDIDLSRLAYRTAGVTYVCQDWATYDFADCSLGDAIAYFDDHVDQGARLIQAADRGVRRLIFDDDFPVTSFAMMAHDGLALPKIEFAIDGNLQGVTSLTWATRHGERSWPVDHSKLSAMRDRIVATERLPNTSLITGIHQTPYRLVSVRSDSESRLGGASASQT